MEQAYNKLAEHFAGNDRVLIAQVNGDRHSSTLRQFDIGGYPTLKYFPMGKQIVEDAHCGRDFESMRDFMERKIAEGSL
jgi:protein disulfide-isomerase A6